MPELSVNCEYFVKIKTCSSVIVCHKAQPVWIFKLICLKINYKIRKKSILKGDVKSIFFLFWILRHLKTIGGKW